MTGVAAADSSLLYRLEEQVGYNKSLESYE